MGDASRTQIPRTAALVGIVAALAGAVHSSSAQGCEPIRFTNPNFGVQGWTQQARQWRLTIGYRYLYSDQWFVGSSEASGMAPGGRAPIIRSHTFVADLEYAPNERLAVHFSVPVSTGSIRRVYPLYDSAYHRQHASGIGDASVSADLWLLDPRSHQSGNLSVGVGVQAPTGNNEDPGTWYTASGPVEGAADGSIQPGSGGWGLSILTRAYARLFERGSGYFSGSYAFTPQAHSDVVWQPGREAWAVADGYSARLGLAYTVLPSTGLSLSLGGRIDGTPVHDVFGGGDEAYRRPGYVIYADPGVALTRGKNYFSLNVPLRLHANRLKNALEEKNSAAINGGGFAKALIFLSYTRRL